MSDDKKTPKSSKIQRSALTKSESDSLRKTIEKARKEIAKNPNKHTDFKECL